ncbi:MAG: metalloregulator ArsR/SmtB family transcription factor [Alphaproteobacteria bacterium]
MQPQPLHRVFHALADPTRLGMVDRLSRGPATVSELAEPLAMAMPSVLKHLKVLEAGGLVGSRKSGRVRTYSLRSGGMSAVQDWVAARRAEWESRFDRLGAVPAVQERDTGQGSR